MREKEERREKEPYEISSFDTKGLRAKEHRILHAKRNRQSRRKKRMRQPTKGRIPA